MDEAQRESLRKAIALVSAAQNDRAGMTEASGVLFGQYLAEDPNFDVNALIGLTNLATILLVILEKATGASPASTLEDIARRYTV